MTLKRRALASLVVLSTGLLVAGCATTQNPDQSSETSAEPKAGGTLVYASGDAEPDCLDPHVGGNYPQALIATQYLEQLVSTDDEGDITPWLADTWDVSDDGLTYTFSLRDDVSFTDGTPLDAASVKASLEHIQDPDTGSSTGYLALEKVDEIDAVDEHTVRLSLSEPDSALLESLAQPWLAIESKAGLERSQDENCEDPIGTGPFKVVEWNKQNSVTLVRNDDYSSPPGGGEAEPVLLDGITWRFLPDSASRYAALKSGEVDIIDNAQPDTIAAAEKNGALTELNAPRPGSVNRLELNSGKAPFDDEKVRKAFVLAADVNPGIESLFFGTAPRSYSPLASVEPMAYAEPDLFATDVDEAEDLLDEAGWTSRDADGYRTKDGERLSVAIPVSTNQSIPAEQSLFEQIQSNVKKVGFDVTLTPLDLPSWYEKLSDNDYDAVSAPYTKLGPDVLRILYHSDGLTPAPSGYFANHAQIDDPDLDELLDEASATQDQDERADYYAKAQKIILEGYYILPLYDQQNHFLLSDSLHGVESLSVGTPSFAQAWLAE